MANVKPEAPETIDVKAHIALAPVERPSLATPSPAELPQHSPTPDEKGFPHFEDGDVLIVSGDGRSWKLHSTTLRNASGRFKTLLDENDARHMTKKQKIEGKTIRFKLEMSASEDSPDIRFRSFRAFSSSSRHSFQVNVNGILNGLGHHQLYDNLFKCFYNIDPEFSAIGDDNGSRRIYDAVSLLQAAEYLDAAKTVRIVIEAHLLRLDQMIWDHVEVNAEVWSDVAIRLQSPILFREAIAHIIGKWDYPNGLKKEFLKSQDNGPAIVKLAEAKVKEIKDKKLHVERLLIEYFPEKMMHPETPALAPGRATYATDIYLWQALCLVRQYVTSAYLNNLHHRALDGGASFYRSIGMGGDAYLGRDVLALFHTNFSMSSKGKTCLQSAVEFFKDAIKPIVADLLVLGTHGQQAPDRILPYLTCAEILDEELPWVVERAEAAAKQRD